MQCKIQEEKINILQDAIGEKKNKAGAKAGWLGECNANASKPKARPSRLQCNEESRAREIQKESMGLMEESLE